MDLKEAFQEAIKNYFDGNGNPEELNTVSKKKLKYTKDYFENVEKDLLGSVGKEKTLGNESSSKSNK